MKRQITFKDNGGIQNKQGGVKMSKWVAFYDSNGKELAAYTEAETFAGEREATTELLAFEHGIQPEEITAKEVER